MEHGLTNLDDILSALHVQRRGEFFYTLLDQSQLSKLPLFDNSTPHPPIGEPTCQAPSEISEMDVLAIVIEEEGITGIISVKHAQSFNAADEPVFTCLTLDVHSGLESVGLTKTVSAVLADNGIACNVIAGFYHDHVLVPAERADEAMQLLNGLKIK